MDKCFDREELIASYLDCTLPEAERRQFEKHLATCDGCLAELIAAQVELREIASETTEEVAALRMTGKKAAAGRRHVFGMLVPHRRFGSFVAAGAVLSSLAAVAAVVLLIITMRSYRFDPDYREGLHLLGKLMEVRAVGELKLSGDGVRAVMANNTYRGNGLLHRNLSIETDERLERALARHPGNAEILNALGHFHMVDGQPEMAVIYYEWALRARPDDPALLNNLAAAVYRTGEITEAERLLLEAEHQENPPPESYFNLGVLYGETGQRELQRVHLEIYLGMVPDSPWADEARRMLEADQPE
jgi:tetratricopeptide (TPR) repeat protein